MDKLNRITYNGKPCRIIAVDKASRDVLLEDEDGNFFTVEAIVVAEQETVTRNNVETR